MTPQPAHTTTSEEAFQRLKDGQQLVSYNILGQLKLETTDTWDKEVVLKDCVVEYFSGSVTQFEKKVQFINCHFKKCQFVFTYFHGGLTIDNCRFDDYLDFQAGGHNKKSKPILITNNSFAGFVNFFDCWYENEVVVTNNNFVEGTNLLSSPSDIPVTFDIDPIIKNNQGTLDVDSEGILQN